MDQQYKISGLEAFFLITFCALADLGDILATFFLDPIFGLGEAVKLIINIFTAPLLFIWGIIKGVRGMWAIGLGVAAEFVPLVGNTAPGRTIAAITVVLMDWHSGAVPLVGTVSKVVGKK